MQVLPSTIQVPRCVLPPLILSSMVSAMYPTMHFFPQQVKSTVMAESVYFEVWYQVSSMPSFGHTCEVHKSTSWCLSSAAPRPRRSGLLTDHRLPLGEDMFGKIGLRTSGHGHEVGEKSGDVRRSIYLMFELVCGGIR